MNAPRSHYYRITAVYVDGVGVAASEVDTTSAFPPQITYDLWPENPNNEEGVAVIKKKHPTCRRPAPDTFKIRPARIGDRATVYRSAKGIRVDIQEGLHAIPCPTGGAP